MTMFFVTLLFFRTRDAMAAPSLCGFYATIARVPFSSREGVLPGGCADSCHRDEWSYGRLEEDLLIDCDAEPGQAMDAAVLSAGGELFYSRSTSASR